LEKAVAGIVAAPLFGAVDIETENTERGLNIGLGFVHSGFFRAVFRAVGLAVFGDGPA
jgi:hypothetical protein